MICLIIFGILSVIFATGMISDNDAENRKNFTIAFCILVVAITVLVIKFM